MTSTHHVTGSIKAIQDHVIVSDMNFGERKINGIIIPGDDGKDNGIRPRWGKVYSVGPKQLDIKVGNWVLVAHGRWTRGVDVVDDFGNITTVRRVDNDDILLVSEDEDRPLDANVSYSK